jgi:hypothetical protein
VTYVTIRITDYVAPITIKELSIFACFKGKNIFVLNAHLLRLI